MKTRIIQFVTLTLTSFVAMAAEAPASSPATTSSGEDIQVTVQWPEGKKAIDIPFSVVLGAGGGSGRAAEAVAAGEPARQPLEYHAGSDIRGYRQLQITTNPPANVVLPRLNAQRCFARWETPLDPTGGRWLCLDRSRKSGLRDRLFADANGDGRLDDEAPIMAARTENGASDFDNVRVVFQGERGPREFHLAFKLLSADGPAPRLLAMTEGWWEGTVDFGGRQHLLQLIDANVNGVFNDVSAYGTNSDAVVVAGDVGSRRSLGRLLEVDSRLFEIEIARDGSSVKVREAENIGQGRVRVPANISELTVAGENGQFVRQPARGECLLPVGAFRVSQWILSRTNEHGALFKLMGGEFSEAGNFEVAAGKPVSLEIGEPLRAILEATQSSKNEITFALGLQGRLGEWVLMPRPNRPWPPQLRIASLDGKYVSTNMFSYG
ncbi:MAG: hypothetical protein ABSG04_01195 [Verrucomicrobiota bacterium]|jgi:hypothetical protein